MSINFDCQNCGKPLFAQAQYSGRQIKCPGCGTLMTIPSATPAATPPLPSVPPPLPSTAVPPPLPVAAQAVADEFPCPMCGERIKTGAKKCRFCGEILDPDLKRQAAAVGAAEAVQDYRARPVARGSVDLGAALSTGFEAFKRYWLMGAGMVFVTFLLAFIFGVIFFMVVIAGAMGAAFMGGAGGGGVAAGILAVFVIFLAYGVLWCFVSVLFSGLTLSGIKMADAVSGRPVEPQFEDIFTGFKRPWSILGSTLLIILILMPLHIVGELAGNVHGALQFVFIVVQVWILLRLIMSIPLIMDRGLGAVDSISTSWKITSGNALMLFVALFLAGLVVFLGLLGFLVGILFTAVIGMGACGALYRQVSST